MSTLLIVNKATLNDPCKGSKSGVYWHLVVMLHMVTNRIAFAPLGDRLDCLNCYWLQL